MVDSDDPLGGAAITDAPLLSDEEIEAAKQEARDRFRADAIKAAKKQVVEAEITRLKRAEGQHTGDNAKDEMVVITLDLAEHSACLVVNGEPFWHGHTYTRPRHVVDSLREQMMRGWNHQDQIDGKSTEETYKRRRLSTINGRTGGIHNAPTPVA